MSADPVGQRLLAQTHLDHELIALLQFPRERGVLASVINASEIALREGVEADAFGILEGILVVLKGLAK